MRFLFILFFIPSISLGQSVGVAPYSFSFWGSVDQTTQFSVEYEMVGIHYFHTWDDTVYRTIETGQIVKKTSTFAISFLPVDYRYFRFGGALFSNQFPITNGSRLHFYLELALPIWRFEINYRHISNGFNLFTENNPGFDTIGVKYRF